MRFRGHRHVQILRQQPVRLRRLLGHDALNLSPHRGAAAPALEANPHRTNDNTIRMNSVSDLFSSGMVYAPLGRRWVEEVGQEFAEFPDGEFDDLADAGVWGSCASARAI